MKVIVGNNLEKLVRCLADRLAEPPAEKPLVAQTVVVQSAGMAKWILLKLAEFHGIAANYRFPFPRKFLEEVFAAFIPGYAPDPYFDASVMTWALWEMLPGLVREEEFGDVARYLGEKDDPAKRYQLAGQIAQAFDQYLIFRPQMVLDWEEGRLGDASERWQAALWRRLMDSRPQGMHPARARRLFLSAVKKVPCRPEVLPPLISVFGISYLPPAFLEMFFLLSAHRPVDYYYWNPSPEFWADIRSGREIGAALGRAPAGLSAADDDLLHLESANALLASWGAEGRDFFRLMSGLNADYIEVFAEPAGDRLLTAVQRDIYRLEEPYGRTGAPAEYSAGDDSLQVHACHTPLREVEVLHDVLLSLFEKNAALTPEDVLVMMPDIEAYAPFIEAVFETREPKIPYTIADRGLLSESVVCRGFLSLLDLAFGRFPAGEVLSVLENAAIAEEQAIGPEDLELIRHWVSDTQIRWGIDAEHRRAFDLPAFDQNTWRRGLDRLFAGFALDGRTEELFADILPWGKIEVAQAEVLGRFLAFWEKLVQWKDVLRQARPLAGWSSVLKRMAADFLPSSDAYRQEVYFLSQALAELSLESRHAGSLAPVDASIIRTYLERALAGRGGQTRFLAGGVSFCALVPMRSIPFDVICLAGMNSDAYPRRDRLSGFSVMETRRRAGDRSQRQDDQYLFLESLISAGKYLIISHIGQSAEDNSDILPSGLVSELLDYLDRNYRAAGKKTLSEEITRKHPLHGFSAENFRADAKYASYSRQDYEAARAILSRKERRTAFAAGGLPEAGALPCVVTIADLTAFYRNPAKAFLENRLGLKLPAAVRQAPDDSEPFHLDPFGAYRIRQDLVESFLANSDEASVLRRKRAEGVLPVGAAGDYYFRNLASEARTFAGRVAAFRGGPREDLMVDIAVGGCRLTGRVDHLYDAHRLHYRMATLTAHDYFSVWIRHLALNAAVPAEYPRTTLVVGSKVLERLGPVENAGEILATLIRYYFVGLNRPLKFFPRTTWEYARALWRDGKSRPDALWAAASAWQGDEYSLASAEGEDPACRICFAGDLPLDTEFEKTAADIAGSLCRALNKKEQAS